MSDKTSAWIRKTRGIMASLISANQIAYGVQEEAYFADILQFDENGQPIHLPPPEGSPEGTLGPIASSLQQEDFVDEFKDLDVQEFLEALAGMLELLNGADPHIVKLLYKCKATNNLPPNTVL